MRRLVVFVLLLAVCPHSALSKTTAEEVEDVEQILIQLEGMGKTLQELIQKYSSDSKNTEKPSNAQEKKIDEALAKLKNDLSKGRSPSGKSNNELMKQLRTLFKKFSDGVLDDVNNTVKELNKLSEDIK